MIDWLLSFIPWWGWLIAAMAAFGIIRIYTGSWRLAAAAVLALLSLGKLGSAYRKGWQDREQKEVQNADKAVKRAGDARADANRVNADPKRLRESDGWRRD